ncbi:MAG: hypothetical protein WC556_10040 [Candidatus Methanoperedens sp.]
MDDPIAIPMPTPENPINYDNFTPSYPYPADENIYAGLEYLYIPLFLLLIPIIISFVVLYTITKDKKRSIVGTIIGYIGAFVIGFTIPVWNGEGIIWLLTSGSWSSPYIMTIVLGSMTTFIGLIVLQIRKK